MSAAGEVNNPATDEEAMTVDAATNPAGLNDPTDLNAAIHTYAATKPANNTDIKASDDLNTTTYSNAATKSTDITQNKVANATTQSVVTESSAVSNKLKAPKPGKPQQKSRQKKKTFQHVLLPDDGYPCIHSLQFRDERVESSLRIILDQIFLPKRLVKLKCERTPSMSAADRKFLLKTRRKTRELELKKERGINESLRKYLFVGFNSVRKALGEKKIRFCLVDVQCPRNLGRVLLPLLEERGVPVLGVEALQHLTKEAIGFKVTVLGFSDVITENFEPLYSAVTNALTALDEMRREGESKDMPENVDDSIKDSLMQVVA